VAALAGSLDRLKVGAGVMTQDESEQTESRSHSEFTRLLLLAAEDSNKYVKAKFKLRCVDLINLKR